MRELPSGLGGASPTSTSLAAVAAALLPLPPPAAAAAAAAVRAAGSTCELPAAMAAVDDDDDDDGGGGDERDCSWRRSARSDLTVVSRPLYEGRRSAACCWCWFWNSGVWGGGRWGDWVMEVGLIRRDRGGKSAVQRMLHCLAHLKRARAPGAAAPRSSNNQPQQHTTAAHQMRPHLASV